jgi:hypothetical protein
MPRQQSRFPEYKPGSACNELDIRLFFQGAAKIAFARGANFIRTMNVTLEGRDGELRAREWVSTGPLFGALYFTDALKQQPRECSEYYHRFTIGQFPHRKLIDHGKFGFDHISQLTEVGHRTERSLCLREAIYRQLSKAESLRVERQGPHSALVAFPLTFSFCYPVRHVPGRPYRANSADCLSPSGCRLARDELDETTGRAARDCRDGRKPSQAHAHDQPVAPSSNFHRATLNSLQICRPVRPGALTKKRTPVGAGIGAMMHAVPASSCRLPLIYPGDVIVAMAFPRLVHPPYARLTQRVKRPALEGKSRYQSLTGQGKNWRARTDSNGRPSDS